MFKNKAPDGKLNLCGLKIAKLRQAKGWSQKDLAVELQRREIDLEKNAVQRIESGKRFVIDVELRVLASIFDVSCDSLLSDPS